MAIDVRALSKLHGTTPVLLDVTFSIPHGALAALTGPAGAGKSTLLKLLAGTLSASGGRIRLFDRDIRHARLTAMADIGFVPQARSACTSMPLSDVLLYAGRARGLSHALLEERVHDVVHAWGLAPHLSDRCDTASPAVRARIDIAVASLHTPRLLLLDDPFTGLDTHETADLLARLERRAPAGTTVLATAGRPPACCARVLRLERGRLADAP